MQLFRSKRWSDHRCGEVDPRLDPRYTRSPSMPQMAHEPSLGSIRHQVEVTSQRRRDWHTGIDTEIMMIQETIDLSPSNEKIHLPGLCQGHSLLATGRWLCVVYSAAEAEIGDGIGVGTPRFPLDVSSAKHG